MRMMEAVMRREGGRRDGGQPILHALPPPLTIGITICRISKFTADNFLTVYTVTVSLSAFFSS